MWMKDRKTVSKELSASNHPEPIKERDEDKISVLIANPIRLYAEGLARLLARETGFELKGTTTNADSLVVEARSLKPDIILLDRELSDSLTIIKTLLEVAPSSRTIALALVDDESSILKFAEAGVSGFVTRGKSYEELLLTIRSVAKGELICTPRIAAMLLRRVGSAGSDTSVDLDRFTPREIQIINLIDQGLSNKEIAFQLNIEISTVKNHVHHIIEKSNTTGRRLAASRARRAFRVGAGRGSHEAQVRPVENVGISEPTPNLTRV